MEDQTDHMYLFIDIIPKEIGPSVQVDGSIPNVIVADQILILLIILIKMQLNILVLIWLES